VESTSTSTSTTSSTTTTSTSSSSTTTTLPKQETSYLILIDTSGSINYYGGEKIQGIEKEKQIAINIIEELSDNDRVGVISFSTTGQIIANIRPVVSYKDFVIKKIIDLNNSGGTDLVQPINMVGEILELERNKRVAVILSDGIIRLTSLPETLESLRNLQKKNITVYLIQIGDDEVGMSTFKYLAQASGGVYLPSERYLEVLTDLED